MNMVEFDLSSQSISNFGLLLGLAGAMRTELEAQNLDAFRTSLKTIGFEADDIREVRDVRLLISDNNENHELHINFLANDHVDGGTMVGTFIMSVVEGNVLAGDFVQQ